MHPFSSARVSFREAARDDLDSIQRFAAEANDAPYDLSAAAEEKCFGKGIKGSPMALLAVDDRGQIDGLAVTCGEAIRILAVRRSVRSRGIGGALLAASEEHLRGNARIVIAAEAGNYFTPGIVASDEKTLRFFLQRGYERFDETDNLVTDLAGIETLPSRAPQPNLPYRGSQARRGEALAYIEREFGRIWRFESEPAFDREEPSIFLVDHEAAIAGFAAHDANNRGLGFFGPTGVSPVFRGRGLGRILLMASLMDLRAAGFSRVVIPWTDSLGFYRKSCGAVPEHHFVQLRKHLR